MDKRIKFLLSLFVILMVVFLAACGNQNGTINSGDTQVKSSDTKLPEEDPIPVQESYEYTTVSRVYANPSVVTVERQVEYLSLTTDDGFFYCETTDTQKADAFINAQRTLLRFLRDNGVETTKLNYYTMDNDDCFSESDKKRAHIPLSRTQSYQQVLITLQTLWGDFTDYGYLYAVANVVADRLGWQVDVGEELEQTALDTFFVENSIALNLLYPCFTTTYASEETVLSCMALSTRLFEKLDLKSTLAKPVDEQVNAFRTLVDGYAQELSITFSRQESGYAYCGEYLPLKISTPYVLHFIDRDYEDYYLTQMEELGDDSWDYFSDYQSIFETVETMNEEIARSVSHFGLEDKVGLVAMYWLSTESSEERFNIPDYAIYHMHNDGASYDGTIYVTKLNAYLHEYFHHIDGVLSGGLHQTWQEQAFADLGDTQSKYSRYLYELPLLRDEQVQELFRFIYGRDYKGGMEDYYDSYDLFCSGLTSYVFDYENGRNEWKSLTHYLLDLYGEETVTEMFLYSENVEALTGKTWEELQAEWWQHMAEKFAAVLSN